MAMYIEEEWQKSLTDLEIGDGITTKPRIITRSDIENFAILTGDPNPHLLDEKASIAAGWKGQIAHGMLVPSLVIGLLFQAGFIRKATVYMGTNNMKLLAPVYADDYVRVETEILMKKQTKKGNWISTYKWLAKNQDNVVVAEGENT
jgi:oxepin-CoA hydrolase / 3-oxo-5,6-dehydrosuberyl-CoA semialdehyde dehydrogenase